MFDYHHVTMAEAEEHINSIPRFTKEKHSMEELRGMLSMLHAEPDGRKVIHVAGTNGKGSVCAFLGSIYREAGLSTAVFTSPHLVKINERFSFDGKMVSDEVFLRAYAEVLAAEEPIRQKYRTIPSYFEYLFLMFCVMCREIPTDRIVLETGLGGRLDATNCLEKPHLTAITSISLDHMQFLGDTVAKIAGEKAGIICDGVPVVYDDTDPDASRVMAKAAGEHHADAYPVGTGSFRDLHFEDGMLRISAKLIAGGEQNLKVPFAAPYQAVNAMIAMRIAELDGIRPDTAAAGIYRMKWPARMERIAPEIYLDGGHNEGGIRAFAGAAKEIAQSRPDGTENGTGAVRVLFAVASDKEYEKMLGIIRDRLQPDKVYLTVMQSMRTLSEDELRKAAEDTLSSYEVFPSVPEALRRAAGEKKPGDLLFICGSLYLAGEIKGILK
ncbi:MAG: bifunctional folylpolyglutamate synthase/dihydrofolate synthase [Clostridium sp.]|nr:bifunctional folylpolyglutamate synthase/dihydrofolate synthase [Clostridium sp.]